VSDGGPAYKIVDLVAACAAAFSTGIGVDVFAPAVRNAREYFGLRGKVAIFDFIATGGLEDYRYKDTRPLELEGGNKGRPVDAYYFYSGPTLHGYLAFFKAISGIWIIKSFKENKEGDQRNLALYDEIRKLTDGK
jgi:uroporphyrinogen-III synthase